MKVASLSFTVLRWFCLDLKHPFVVQFTMRTSWMNIFNRCIKLAKQDSKQNQKPFDLDPGARIGSIHQPSHPSIPSGQSQPSTHLFSMLRLHIKQGVYDRSAIDCWPAQLISLSGCSIHLSSCKMLTHRYHSGKINEMTHRPMTIFNIITWNHFKQKWNFPISFQGAAEILILLKTPVVFGNKGLRPLHCRTENQYYKLWLGTRVQVGRQKNLNNRHECKAFILGPWNWKLLKNNSDKSRNISQSSIRN